MAHELSAMISWHFTRRAFLQTIENRVWCGLAGFKSATRRTRSGELRAHFLQPCSEFCKLLFQFLNRHPRCSFASGASKLLPIVPAFAKSYSDGVRERAAGRHTVCGALLSSSSAHTLCRPAVSASICLCWRSAFASNSWSLRCSFRNSLSNIAFTWS